MDAINLLTSIALPASFGAPAVPLQPGQVIDALVLELLNNGAVRLQLPQAVLDVRSDVPLTPGTTVALAVKGSASGMRLEILAPQSPVSQSNAAITAGIAPASVAADPVLRRPIGEAVVIARSATPDTKPATTPATVQAAKVETAPPLDTARPPATPDPATPARALAQAVQSAAARQGSLAPLFADVEQVLQSTGPALPTPVREAAAQVLAFRLPLDATLTAPALKQALTQSGTLLEPKLAAAAAVQSAAPKAGEGAAPPPDLKAALLVLRQVLRIWAGELPQPAQRTTATPAPPASIGLIDIPLSLDEAVSAAKSIAAALQAKATPAPAAMESAAALPPPYRGAPLSVQPPALAAILTDAAPHEIAERLLTQTDAALARQTLVQAASLPDTHPDAPRHADGPRWTFELPVATPQGTAVLPFEVSRDGHAASAEQQGRAWRVRFSLDLEPIGPVHALVTLMGDSVSVTVSAERHATAAQLNDNAALLGDALRAAELEPSELAFRVGVPRAAKPAVPGQFMDRAS